MPERPASAAITDTAQTRLGRAVANAPGATPGASGVFALANPKEAFAARVLLARAAERSLDVQYYIWHRDTTGFLMLGEIWNAAERGVRVRLLLDDNGIAGLDPTIAALGTHPNIEVRLFNPYPNRGFKPLGYLTHFNRLNHRMHNKSFTADGQATIVGGRNIGDEYFGAGDGTVFADLDVVAVGAIAGEVGKDFDQYWSSESTYPASALIRAAKPEDVAALKSRFAAVRGSSDAEQYLQAVRATRLVETFLAKELKFDWSRVELISDEPIKTLGKAEKKDLLFTHLKKAVGNPEKELDIVSPYFVPGKQGTRTLSDIPRRGVSLRIVTNSLAATDVAAVHAGYAKRRKTMLQSGVRLWELKPDAPRLRGTIEVERKKGSGGSAGSGGSGGSGGSHGSSSASLHAKTFSVDRRRVFVGSFNLDQRSLHLNTEMGLVVESAELAQAISGSLDRELGRVAYEVRLRKDGHGLVWIERTETGEIEYRHDPKTGFFKRLIVSVFSILPIEWML